MYADHAYLTTPRDTHAVSSEISPGAGAEALLLTGAELGVGEAVIPRAVVLDLDGPGDAPGVSQSRSRRSPAR